MVLPMRGLFKHYLLAALLIFHTSWGSVMAAQMQTSHLKMGTPDSAMLVVATIDRTASEPCPHHSNVMESTSTQAELSKTNCNGHDCSNCNCVNVLSSIPVLTILVNDLPIDRSNALSFIASPFPDSPPGFILRPPIS